MVDLDCKTDMVSSKSPKLSMNLNILIPPSFFMAELTPASSSACASYEHYIRLSELKNLWSMKEFPNWERESILKPALQGLEITFRFISIVLSDTRVYTNRREWKRRLESLSKSQIQIIAVLCEEEAENQNSGSPPLVDLSFLNDILAKGKSSTEVWKLGGDSIMVNRLSEESLLPRLASWQKTEDIAQKILFCIECEMQKCSYTLGLGEPNLAGKPNLDYDRICRPSELHSLKRKSDVDNREIETVFTTHQILESWICAASELLLRAFERIESEDFENASSDCWLLERIWKLLSEIEDLHILSDPDDFLKLKNQLSIQSTSNSPQEAFCFRSRGLVEITKRSKELRQKVPHILGVEVDPKGGPRIQEAAMKLYQHKQDFWRIHLLQALQAIESSLKRFYFAYRQLVAMVMGSLEVKGNRVLVPADSCDSLSRIFLEPTYFPSLDGAKTFLGDLWEHQCPRAADADRQFRTQQ